jgi:CBS domain-containing protein
MLVHDLLRLKIGVSEIATLPPAATIVEAAKILSDLKIGLLVIKDGGESFDGVLSERDIVRLIATHGEAALQMPVSSVMTKTVITCKPGDHTCDVMAMMTSGGFRHMPVARDDKLVGLVSSTDIFRYLSEHANSDEQALMWSKISWV